MLYQIAKENNYNWDINLENTPDKILAKSKKIVVTSDAWILNNCRQWFNLAGYIIEKKMNLNTII